MTTSRPISPDTRSALLVATGTSLILAPFMIGLGIAAVASGVFIGAIVVGLGFAGTAFTGRGTIPVSAHVAFDQGLAFGLVLGAVIFALAGELSASAIFLLAGTVQLIVGTRTRYTVNSTSAA